MTRHASWMGVLLCILTSMPTAKAKDDDPSSPAQLIKMLVDSPRLYNMSTDPPRDVAPERFLDVMWPEKKRAIPEAECPEGGTAEERLAVCDRALQQHPEDITVHLCRARALLELKRYEPARDALVKGLALTPRHPALLSLAKENADALGIVVADEPFRPRSLVRKNGDATDIYIDVKAGAAWTTFAICKAVWLGEVEYVQRRTGGRTANTWSSTEDVECLANLVVSATMPGKKEKEPIEPQIERLRQITDSHLLGVFVLYELGSRGIPDVVLHLPPAQRTQLETYIAAFVLPLRDASAR